MWTWIREHPWIWIVFFFLAVFAANFALIVLSILNAPVEVPH